MKTKAQYKEDLTHYVKSQEDILNKAKVEGRADLNAEEVKRFGELKKDIEFATGKIEGIEAFENMESEVAERSANLSRPAPRKVAPSTPTSEISVPAEARSAESEIFDSYCGKLNGFKSEKEAYRAGQYLLSLNPKNVRAQRYCEENGVINRTALSTSSGLTYIPLSNAIILNVQKNGVVRNELNFFPMDQVAQAFPVAVNQFAAAWKAEGVAAAESEPSFTSKTVTVAKICGYSMMSKELSDSAVISMATYMAEQFSNGIKKVEDESVFIGDGTSTYNSITGVKVALEGTNLSKVAAPSGTNTFAEIVSGDIAALCANLPSIYHEGAKFYCSPAFKWLVFNRLGLGYAGNTAANAAASPFAQYQGIPIVEVPCLESSAGDLATKCVLLFGRLDKAVLAGQFGGVNIETSDQFKWLEGQLALKCEERVGFNNWNVGGASAYGALSGLVLTA